MEKIVYFGAGQIYSELKDRIAFFEEQLDISSYGIMDNNSAIWGNMVYEKKVIPPQKIAGCDYYVVMTTEYYEEIKKQLVESYQVELEKIVWFGEYFRSENFRSKYAKIQYNKKYKGKTGTGTVFDVNKITVYTCITGDYDQLKEPLYISENIEYICFTNNLKIKSDIWKIVYVGQEHYLDNVHLARYIKLFPDKFLRNEGTSVWVDAKYMVKDDLREYIKQYGKLQKMLCFPHPERDCIYQEAEVCINVGKVNAEAVNIQLNCYRNAEYSLHNGLYETGCIVRLHGDKEVQELMKKWWREIETFTYRDQISLPYVCKENNMFPDICDIDINVNRWLQVYEHNIRN